MGTEKKRLAMSIFFFVAIFVVLFAFFRFVNPVMVFDTDDWTYISYARDAFPTTREWNPTRIFPEIVMPVLGFLSAFVLTPLTGGNYLGSVNTVFVAAIAMVITLYLVVFAWAMRRAFHLEQGTILSCTLLFLIAHFWVFRSGTTRNMYLLYAKDMTCYFYYTLPTIMNGMLVMVFEERPYLWDACGPLKKGALVLALYLAICSNLFSSIVIATYCGIVLLFRVFVKSVKERSWRVFRKALGDNRIYFATLVGWLVTLLFEMSGGRAESIGFVGKTEGLKTAAECFFNILGESNLLFFFFCFGIMLITALYLLGLFCKKKQDEASNRVIRKMSYFLLAAVIVSVYQILLCGVTGAPLTYYTGSGDVLISIYFYLFAAVFSAMGYLVSKVPKCQIAIPLVVCIALFNCNTLWNTFREPGHYNTSNVKAVSQITEDIYEQVIEANEKHLKAIEIRVPDYRAEGNENNWPLTTTYLGERLARTLFKHGQIDCLMEITIIPDSVLNEAYNIK